MKDLQKSIESLFEAFQNDETVNLDDHRASIMQSFTALQREHEAIEERLSSFDQLEIEKGQLRKAVSVKCVALSKVAAGTSALSSYDDLSTTDLLTSWSDLQTWFDQLFRAVARDGNGVLAGGSVSQSVGSSVNPTTYQV